MRGIRMKRESFGSRLGFLFVSAGCAIGIGNVWRFPLHNGSKRRRLFRPVLPYLPCCHGYPRADDGALRSAARAGRAPFWATRRLKSPAASGTSTAGSALSAAIC